MKKKPPGLYANIHAKRERGEEMRKPGEEGAPSASDFKNAAKTAKKKKNAKRQDPKGNPAGYYDKEGCKECGGGKKPCRCGKKDMGRSGPYADGYGKKCDAIAEEFNGILINDAERADKPCGNSYIPETAKCSKGRGAAKASMKSLKKRALAKEQEVNKGRNVRPTPEQAKQQAQAKEREVNKGRSKKKVNTGKRVLGTYLGTMSAIAGATQAAQAGEALAKGQYGKALGSASQAVGNLSGANAFASGNFGRGFKRQVLGNAGSFASYLGSEGTKRYKSSKKAKGMSPLQDLYYQTRERAAGVRRMPRK